MREEKNGQNGWSNLSKHPDTAYYLQDELGSPIRFLDEEGNMRETYGYDEFGQDLYRNQGQIQPFGYMILLKIKSQLFIGENMKMIIGMLFGNSFSYRKFQINKEIVLKENAISE